ncbi:MAG TPA: isoprenylcysteine carboxylmethyltransferase family protein [Thermoanaerobaculia bacterium]|nr:isoprenylcysteine carboxylmethyltransferase family protein [Thermoanaerobaculia bacterium]
MVQLSRVFPPPVLFMICVCAGSVAEGARPLPIGSYDFRGGVATGLLAFVLAGVIGCWAILEMRRHHTTVEPGHTPSELVTSGPFRFSRNPIYLALLLVISGLPLAANSLWLLVASAVLLLLLDSLVVRREEKAIQEAFGDEYLRYRNRVRRWM